MLTFHTYYYKQSDLVPEGLCFAVVGNHVFDPNMILIQIVLNPSAQSLPGVTEAMECIVPVFVYEVICQK
jgi:hypothetical protein